MNKTVPFNIGSDIEPELINNAIITITTNGQNFVLSPVIKKPGRCFYDGTDLSVNISYNY